MKDIKPIFAPLCALALSGLVPLRKLAGWSHTKLIRGEALLSTQLRRLRDRRDEAGAHFVGAVVATLICMVAACGPSRATRTALDEVRRLDAQCSAELDALHFDPGPNPDGDARIQAVLTACRERASAFCAAHHIDHSDTEACP